jgi:hypothetical protein
MNIIELANDSGLVYYGMGRLASSIGAGEEQWNVKH